MKSEQELIDSMTSILQSKMQKDYANGNIKRDAHPKDLGLLKGTFTIVENLPTSLSKGIFKHQSKFNCFIRLSSSSGKVQSDAIKDARGFAIKLLGVEGERLNNAEKSTQDFILMSFPTMPLGTVKLFHDAVYYLIKWNPLILFAKFMFSGKLHILKALKNSKANQTSCFDIQYWSTTPYQFDDTMVKYSIVPTSTFKSTLPNTLTDNYLMDNNATHLKNSEASFDFLIQFYKDEQHTPIEDASVAWDEKISPFVKLATLTIPKQDILTTERKELAETIAFSPSNTLTVHKPLGGINRARIQIYERLSIFRHMANNKKIIEPDNNLYDQLG